MATASYKHGVQWIANNDSAGNDDALDVTAVSELITTALLADLFDKDPIDVAKSIINYRLRNS